MDVIAHRGFAAAGPENALTTLRRATDRADAVEFDVRLAGDGEPVVVHDRRVDRLTDASGAVTDFTAAELAALCVDGTDEGVPTLADVLDALTGPVVVDYKSPEFTDRTAALLRDYLDPVLVSSFRLDLLRSVPADLDTAVLCGPGDLDATLPDGAPGSVADAISVARSIGASALHPHHSQCSPDLLDRARAAALQVNAWTVRSRDVGDRLRRLGVDGAITDSPDYVEQ